MNRGSLSGGRMLASGVWGPAHDQTATVAVPDTIRAEGVPPSAGISAPGAEPLSEHSLGDLSGMGLEGQAGCTSRLGSAV